MKENSIEETIKQLKLILKIRKEQKEIIECAGGSCMNCDPDIKALSKSIEILSDYKRVLKDNEYMHNELNKQQTTINKYAKENEELENITDKMIDYIMIHQQVKTMRKIFCKHCKLQNSCTYSGIHRNCVIRYFEYISKQGNINEMHEELEKILESEE